MNAFITNLLTLRHLVICSRPLVIRLLVIMLCRLLVNRLLVIMVCRLLVIRLLVKTSNASSLALNSFILRRLVIHALVFGHPSIRPHYGSSLHVFRHQSSYYNVTSRPLVIRHRLVTDQLVVA